MRKHNKLYLLKNIAIFLELGYPIETVLEICRNINYESDVVLLENELVNGISVDQAILNLNFHDEFNRYFTFFRLNNNIAKAINQSIEIVELFQNFKKTIFKKMTYPMCLLIFMLFFSLFVIYGLLPSVYQLFQNFEIEQDTFSKIIFSLFSFIPVFIILVCICSITSVTFLIISIKNNNYRIIDEYFLKLPFVSKYVKYYYSLKFTIYYNELLKNGYDTSMIIETLYKYIPDNNLKMLVYEIRKELLKGESLQEIVENFRYFDKTFKECFRIMLLTDNKYQILENYQQITISRIENTISRIIKIIIPFIYVFVTGFVITIYISIILPMMNVVNNM